jgi:hypothetical protein
MTTLAETLYYLTYNSVLLGESNNAKMYLTFLREEFDRDQKQFEPLKEDERWEHLVEMGAAIDNGKVAPCSFKVDQVKDENKNVSSRPDEEAQFKKQIELVNALCLAKDDLRMCLEGDSDFHCCGSEIETRFGRVDLVAQDKTTIYPIEVKKSGAYHDCVGQIMKYMLHYKLGLINKIYRHVIGVVVANSFDSFVLSELRKSGIVAVQYKFKGDLKIELMRL